MPRAQVRRAACAGGLPCGHGRQPSWWCSVVCLLACVEVNCRHPTQLHGCVKLGASLSAPHTGGARRCTNMPPCQARLSKPQRSEAT
eukprot:361420-Chlamydomonas_euryale.AAC.5